MELYEMIYSRLRNDEEIASLTAVYNGGAAVFYQRPASAENARWGSEIQYPRIDYTLDLTENPARNTSGVLTVNVWCDAQIGAEPEDIEARVRELLHAVFAQADDYTYCFAWVRSDAFEIKGKADETVRTYGVTSTFDVVACPSQYTMYPDPIKGLNAWTRQILPDAVIIGEDTINGWLVPTKEKPAIYWRLTSQGKARQHFAYTWLDISVECHVYCKHAADRLYNLVKINTAHALTGHITLEDTSPLFLKTFQLQPHLNYIITGQIRATGQFGLLQPQSHLQNKATGEKLEHVEIGGSVETSYTRRTGNAAAEDEENEGDTEQNGNVEGSGDS